MRRNVDPDFEFNKDRFAEVLKSAIGDRSYSAFGKEAGISFGYISKYMNHKSEVSPTIQTLKKMVNVSASATYAELLNAAGYDETKFEDDVVSIAVAQASPAWSPMNALLPALYQAEFDWKFEDTTSGGPLSVKIEDAPFDMWYFIPVVKETVSKEDVLTVLGSKEAEVINPESKVTFLTASKEVFNAISEMELNLLSFRVSVAYITPGRSTVEEERYVKTAVVLTDKDQEIILRYSESENQGPLSL